MRRLGTWRARPRSWRLVDGFLEVSVSEVFESSIGFRDGAAVSWVPDRMLIVFLRPGALGVQPDALLVFARVPQLTTPTHCRCQPLSQKSRDLLSGDADSSSKPDHIDPVLSHPSPNRVG